MDEGGCCVSMCVLEEERFGGKGMRVVKVRWGRLKWRCECMENVVKVDNGDVDGDIRRVG